MASPMTSFKTEKDLVVLSLLEQVERDGAKSQRHMASELGIAVGLVNAYLKRCVKKGLVKVNEAPARRYAYYLTPQGFAEKSRLTLDYLSYSFSFFRDARADCADVFAVATARGYKRVAIAGMSDLAEIARICALDSGVDIVAVVDDNAGAATFVGVPVVASFAAIGEPFDAVVVTDLRKAREVFDAAVAHIGADRVLAPKMLGLRPRVELAE
ncbi:MAG: winged helix-turn-helix transcriptional regulator [Rhodopseudomonas sp.]|nr:winged helix-turn-helix transcriptional regulator [Rhodopseudomonas sp.]